MASSMKASIDKGQKRDQAKNFNILEDKIKNCDFFIKIYLCLCIQSKNYN